METVRCNLCGSEEEDHQFVYSMPDKLYFSAEWFTVVECKNCGLGFVNPRPSSSEIFKYYPQSFYNSFENERNYHERRYQAQSKFLQDAATQDKKLLLDIGCANGDFPRYMQKLGWQVEGVEVSPNSNPISDFKVYRQDLTHIPILEPYYDAVTAWAVLEHVHDPKAYFEKVAKILKLGGLFVFLVTNFSSISSRHLFREDLPRHLYFFTEKTVRRYLSTFGFTLMRTDYSNKIYKMPPRHWLRYYTYRYFKGKLIEWEDIPISRMEYFTKHGLGKNFFSNLRYTFSLAISPLDISDIILMPVFERYQMLSRSYGIVTYIAKKS